MDDLNTRRCYHLPPQPVVPDAIPPEERRRLVSTVLTAVTRVVQNAASGLPAVSILDDHEPPRFQLAGFEDGGPLGGSVESGGWARDRLLGITVIRVTDLETRINNVIAAPRPEAAEAGREYRANPAAAKASLFQSHRDDAARLSYALGHFRAYLETMGPVDSVELFSMLLSYETWVQNQIPGQVVLSRSPTAAERQRLSQLRSQRGAEQAKWRAAEARRQAAEAKRQAEPERAKIAQSPEDLSGYPDPAEGGPYVNQGLTLPYLRLVPYPDPRRGFDEDEVNTLLNDPRRMEQLYYDATHGIGRAAWLAVAFESRARDLAVEVAQSSSILTPRGLEQALLGTGYFRLGGHLSFNTKSGRRLYSVFLHTLAEQALKVQVSNQVIANAMALLQAGKLTEAALMLETRIPAVPAPQPTVPEALPAAPAAPAEPVVPAEPVAPLEPVALPEPPQPLQPLEPVAPPAEPAPPPTRPIGFQPPGNPPAAPTPTGAARPLSRPVAGFGREVAPRPEPPASPPSGPTTVDMPPVRVVPGQKPATARGTGDTRPRAHSFDDEPGRIPELESREPRPTRAERFQRGNDFNQARQGEYHASEVDLENGKRLDSYEPGKEIVSRKHTQLSKLDPTWAEEYINEFLDKYGPGNVVKNTPRNRELYPELVGKPLRGKLVLEVPIQEAPVPQEFAEWARRWDITIRDTAGTVYN
jgi:hypothetical protein